MSVALISALLIQTAPAQRPPPSMADLPAWSKAPSIAEMQAAWPQEALRVNYAGSAVIECSVTADGGLAQCAKVNESAPGFGDAALTLAPKFQMPTKAPSGASTAGRTVQFPIRWLGPTAAKLPPLVVYDDARRSGSMGFNCRVRDDRSLDNCVLVDARPQGTTLMAPAGEAAQRAKAPASAKTWSRVLVVVEVKPT